MLNGPLHRQLTFPSFIIHNLRLGYLRNVEDPYGPRLISLSPSYTSNPYILASSLADVERWPELAMPISPTPSDDEGPSNPSKNTSGFPGATGLKYTTTIMGPSRTGAYGLRVGGSRRLSTADGASVRASLRIPRRSTGLLSSDDEEGTINGPETHSTPINRSPNTVPEDEGQKTGDTRKEETEAPEQPKSQPKALGFIPKFKGAAEMEARRKVRLMAREPPKAAEPVAPPTWADLDSSSENEADGEGGDLDEEEEEDDGFDIIPAAGNSVDIGDEFDPLVFSFSLLTFSHLFQCLCLDSNGWSYHGQRIRYGVHIKFRRLYVHLFSYGFVK